MINTWPLRVHRFWPKSPTMNGFTPIVRLTQNARNDIIYAHPMVMERQNTGRVFVSMEDMNYIESNIYNDGYLVEVNVENERSLV